jgi:glyoxylase-like metal-dependent hydrolase (beta-lactamase superfamily II)
MLIETAAAAPFFKNGFLLGCERTREAVLIDPGPEAEELLRRARGLDLQIVGLPLTHAHVDHVSGVAEAKRAAPAAPIYLHRDDLFLYEQAPAHGARFGMHVEPLPPVDVYYEGRAPIRFGDYDIVAHHTPGHCPGGVCLQVGRRGEPGLDLFVGDTLFAGSIGRTDFPGGDYNTLLTSITKVLYAFGDDARVYPGHGPMTTIGEERQNNPFLLDWARRNS